MFIGLVIYTGLTVHAKRMNQETRQSEKFLAVARRYKHVLIVMHDNPDPDAIATAWAIKVLLESKHPCTTRIVAGGAIIRAENKYMVELLNPPIELVDKLSIQIGGGAILVDCGLGAHNQILTRSGVDPIAVIDHHQSKPNGNAGLLFNDNRESVAASATIAASYLIEQGIEPTTELATATWYAMRTETCAYETSFADLDREVLIWATTFGSPSLLADIEHAPLNKHYFSDMLLAMQSTFLYGDTALCLLPQAQGVEVVGEVADLLVRCKGVNSVLCAALIDDAIYMSSRTSIDGGDATKILLSAIGDVGSAGGHDHRAGGKLSLSKSSSFPESPEAWRKELRERWLDANGIERKRGLRLVPRKEIVQNL